MRRAPPVAVICNRGRTWPAAQAVLAGAAAAALAAWAARMAGATPVLAALAAALVAGAVAAATGWRLRPRPVALHWDGEVWRLQEQPGEVQVMLDLDRWMLLRWAGTRTHWLAVEQATSGGHWSAIRAALYSPAVPEMPSPPERPTA